MQFLLQLLACLVEQGQGLIRWFGNATGRSLGNSIAFGKSTSQRIYPKQHTP